MATSSLFQSARSFSRILARAFCFAICAVLTLQPISALAQRANPPSRKINVTIKVTPGHPANRITPAHALGAGVDGHSKGETRSQLSPANIDAMLSAGLKRLTYRLRTELGCEAWHWNPKGAWSDPKHRQGYWTSDSALGQPIEVSYGYRLPRRGNTIDQANNDGYSRIDDGDTRSFWKSNPYLDKHYTGDREENFQWVMIDLGAFKRVNAIKILWANPFAVDYAIEHGNFIGPPDLSQRLPTVWRVFPKGKITKGAGGETLIKLSAKPVSARYIRIRLNESSGTTTSNTGDIRDRLGYAIREIYFGALDRSGQLRDVIHHGANREHQTVIFVSSTDPWHRETDIDESTEQPGFDFIFRSGLTNGLPMMVPVGVLYDTPENGAAELRYLTARGYPIEQVEFGEEPDGEFATPEDYGALYMEFYKGLHNIDPHLQFGGPSLQDIEQTQVPGRIEFGKAGWIGRFIRYLQRHDSLDKFSFFSFEWYPFGDDCKPPGEQLQNAPVLLTEALKELQLGGLSKNIPWIISEYGYSAFAARAEVDVEGALLNADSVGRFLTLGGNAAFLYGYEPGEIIKENECSAGNNMLFFHNDRGGHIKERTATYWGARLLTQEWVEPGNRSHEIYPAVSDVLNNNDEQIVTAYAVYRPDGLWSLLLINKDPKRTYEPSILFHNELTGATSTFKGDLEVFQFSGAQYQLNSDRDHPYPIRSQPPVHSLVRDLSTIALPPYSMTVIRAPLAVEWTR
jgi:F5/8 type C domain